MSWFFNQKHVVLVDFYRWLSISNVIEYDLFVDNCFLRWVTSVSSLLIWFSLIFNSLSFSVREVCSISVSFCKFSMIVWFGVGSPRCLFPSFLYPHSPKGEGGILFYLCPSFHPSKIFFVAIFSVTVDGRNLIFGHKHHIGIPYCG